MTNIHLASFPLASQWANFPFDKYSLQDFFSDAVYTGKAIFLSYGLGTTLNSK